MNVLDFRGPEFLVFYIGLLVIALILAMVLRRWLLQSTNDLPPGQIPELHPLEVAYLAGGSKGITDAALAILVQRGSVEVSATGSKLRASSLAPMNVTSLEMEVFDAVRRHQGNVAKIRKAVLKTARAASERLQTLGLVPTTGQSIRARLLPALLVLAVPALGVAKIFVGVGRDRPVVILAILCFLTLFIVLAFLGAAPVHTQAGKRRLKYLRDANDALRATAARAPTSLAGNDLSLAFALYGASIFTLGPMADLNRTLAPPSQGGTGCGSSSGCGGGGDSGGGSGCGGCGGGGGGD